MALIFEVIDKTRRKIHLTEERWKHIRKKHPEIEDKEEIKKTIENPNKVIDYKFDETINYYYKFFKNKKPPKQYLLVVVKYLNGKGFIITAYYQKYIKKWKNKIILMRSIMIKKPIF